MSASYPNSRLVPTRDVLRAAGFVEDWTPAQAGELPGYVYPFRNLDLSVVLIAGSRLRPVFSFSGVFHTNRSVVEIHFEMPTEVESIEQGFAWIVDALDRHEAIPRLGPEWIALGRKWIHLLPWLERQRNFDMRAACRVDRDWLRVAARKLRSTLETAGTDAKATFAFDGTLLRISGGDQTHSLPAEGNVWPTHFAVRLQDACRALRRLMQPIVAVDVWEGHLRIGGRSIVLTRSDARE